MAWSPSPCALGSQRPPSRGFVFRRILVLRPPSNQGIQQTRSQWSRLSQRRLGSQLMPITLGGPSVRLLPRPTFGRRLVIPIVACGPRVRLRDVPECPRIHGTERSRSRCQQPGPRHSPHFCGGRIPVTSCGRAPGLRRHDVAPAVAPAHRGYRGRRVLLQSMVSATAARLPRGRLRRAGSALDGRHPPRSSFGVSWFCDRRPTKASSRLVRSGRG